MREAELSMVRRLGAPEKTILAAQCQTLRVHITRSDGRQRAYACRRKHTLDVRPMVTKIESHKRSQQLRNEPS